MTDAAGYVPHRMVLPAGGRYRLTAAQSAAVQVFGGKAEIYAVTRAATGDTYRQMFLCSREAGQMAFASLDEFESVDMLLYAVEDIELAVWPEAELAQFSDTEALRTAGRSWFAGLMELSWLQYLADRGDDMVGQWEQADFLAAPADSAALWAAVCEHEQILVMLVGMRFKSETKGFSERIELRRHRRRQLVDAAIGNLFDKDMQLEAGRDASVDARLDAAVYAARRVAKALEMNTEVVQLPAEIMKRLDQLALLRRLLQKTGAQMRLVKLEKDWYAKDCGVLLGYFGEKKEIVVLVPETPSTYRMVSKADPEGRLVTAEIAGQLDGDAFVCYAGFPAKKLTVRDLLFFMFQRCWKIDYRTIILASLLAGLVPLFTPIVTETIFSDIIPIQDRQGLATVTQVTMIAAFTMAAVSLVRAIAVLRISNHLDMAVEAALWSRLLSLPTRFFRRFQAGELLQRMQGIEAVKSLVNGGFVGSVFNFLFSFWSLFLMCWYSLKLTAAALAIWIVYFVVVAFIYRRVLRFQRELIQAGNKTAGQVQQIFAGLAKFRIQGAEEQAYYLWSKVFGRQWNWNLKLRWQGNYNGIIASIQPFILTLLLYYTAVYGMRETTADGQIVQHMTYAEFMGFQAAFSGFNATLVSVIPLVAQVFSIWPHVENLQPILDEVPELSEDKLDASVLTGAIEVSHLTFAYSGSETEVLHDISLRVAAGEKVAVVGRSGCGKSTLMRLLLGFETPKSGAVYYDGQDLAELNASSVRSQMGVVLQNGQLMSGDIFTNIVGTSTLTIDDAWAAAKCVGIDEDIREMPMGMYTMISEGSGNISGGQRQRLLIARALAHRPVILLLDEATSALDNRTQAIVTESLRQMHCTQIIVAHRLSTIRDADRILVMDGRTIAEAGTYDELVAKGGLFARLAARQTV